MCWPEGEEPLPPGQQANACKTRGETGKEGTSIPSLPWETPEGPAGGLGALVLVLDLLSSLPVDAGTARIFLVKSTLTGAHLGCGW